MLVERATAFRKRLGAFLHRRRLEQDLADELDFHLALSARRHGSGAAAQRAFGNDTRSRETSRELWGFPGLESLWQDLRHALRQLRRSPAFAATWVLILALGLAATAAIFSIVNGVLLRPLAYPHPDQLVALELYSPQLASKFPLLPINPATSVAWSRHATMLSGISAIDEGETYNLTGGGQPTQVTADGVSANLFAVLGVAPRLGHGLQPGAWHEAVLTNSFWKSRFHSDAGVIGQAVELNGVPYTITGVLPESFHFPSQNELIQIDVATSPPDLFVPLDVGKLDLTPDGGFGLAAIARLRPGVSRAAAVTELSAIVERQIHPPPGYQITASVVPLRDKMVSAARRGLWLLLAAVLAVLLVICVNLANLSLARAASRRQEAALRSALGASRARLLRQALAETCLLGLAGGVLGFALAHAALEALLALAPSGLPRAHDIHLDLLVFGLTLTAGLMAGLLAGLLPAWKSAQGPPQDALRTAGARAGNADGRARAWLVGVETALSALLLVGAGLLLLSFAKLVRTPSGFALEHVLTANLQLPQALDRQPRARQAFWRRLAASAAALPGVERAAVTSWLPLHGELDDDPVLVPGDTRPNAARPYASRRYVSPGFFATLGIPLLRGRALTAADAGQPVAVISAAAAEAVWPGLDPLGRVFDGNHRVVGVAANTRAVSLKAPAAMIYEPLPALTTASLLVRTPLPADAAAAELRGMLANLAPGVALPPLTTMGGFVAAAQAPQRFLALLLALFAAAALLLACLGIYGVVSFTVVRRAQETGVRMALGAQPAGVIRQMVGDGMRSALLGLAAGLIAAVALAHLLSSLLFEVRPLDPLAFAAAAVVLGGVALTACWIPARRAARAHPAAILRQG